MINLTIDVKLQPEAIEAVNNLAGAIAKLSDSMFLIDGIKNAKEVIKTDNTSSKEKDKNEKEEVKEKDTKVTNTEVDSVTATDSKTNEETPSGFEKVEYTLEEVRGKLTQLSRSGKQKDVKTLISEFGASKLTEIKKEHFAEIMMKAEEL